MLTCGDRIEDALDDEGIEGISVVGALDADADGDAEGGGDREDERHEGIAPRPEAGLQHGRAASEACLECRGAALHAQLQAWHAMLQDIL